jgi:hypothetical protein
MRVATVWLLLVFVCGCRGVGYRRPADRNLNAIGSPAVGVGSDGFETGRTLAALPPTPPPVPEKAEEAGFLLASDDSSLTLQRPTGEELRLTLSPRTSILIDGHPAGSAALPEGAEVRASYLIDGNQRLAETVRVQTQH